MAKKEEAQKEQKEQKEKPTEKDALQKRIAQLEANEQELIDILKRLQAEFENYRKRVDREKAEFCVFAKAEMIKKILPFIDTFEIALKNKDKKEDFVKGIEMIYVEIVSMLQKEGVKRIDSVGKKFDSNLHEVLMTEKSDKQDDTIIEEFQRGYTLCDRVLRHSKVKVAKSNGKK